MRKVSLERYYFVLYNGVIPLKNVKNGVLNPFCDKTPQIYKQNAQLRFIFVQYFVHVATRVYIPQHKLDFDRIIIL